MESLKSKQPLFPSMDLLNGILDLYVHSFDVIIFHKVYRLAAAPMRPYNPSPSWVQTEEELRDAFISWV